MPKKQIYIVLSQTGTFLSKTLKLITRAEYNHASICLYSDLKCMYSFGRRRAYNPFIAGFVTESPDSGTFKRFKNTKVIVISLEVDVDKYENIDKLLKQMKTEAKKYQYNYLGLVLAAFKIQRKKANCYYCSEFIKSVMIQNNIAGADKLSKIVHPMNFLDMPHKLVYQGLLTGYK